MKTFTITETNEIAIHGNREAADTVRGAELFTTQDELVALAANWPTIRLVEIWNDFPGNTPITKFTDKKTAVNRIWKAIQTLSETYELADRASAPVAETIQIEEAETPAVAPGPEPAQEPPTFEAEGTEVVEEERQPEVPADVPEPNIGEQTPDVAPTEAATTKKATRKQKAPTGEKAVKAPREESKTSRVIEMLKREGGTTLEEIMSAMGWQKHTTRAMLSAGGSLTKKHGLVVTSEKVGGKRVYSIKA